MVLHRFSEDHLVPHALGSPGRKVFEWHGLALEQREEGCHVADIDPNEIGPAFMAGIRRDHVLEWARPNAEALQRTSQDLERGRDAIQQSCQDIQHVLGQVEVEDGTRTRKQDGVGGVRVVLRGPLKHTGDDADDDADAEGAPVDTPPGLDAEDAEDADEGGGARARATQDSSAPRRADPDDPIDWGRFWEHRVETLAEGAGRFSTGLGLPSSNTN